jgi:hypothetical protein
MSTDGPEPKVLFQRSFRMTPEEYKDMPWIIGAFVALGFIACGATLYRLLT